MSRRHAHSDDHQFAYWLVAKFTSETSVSADDVEYQVRKALQDMRKEIKVEIVQIGTALG